MRATLKKFFPSTTPLKNCVSLSGMLLLFLHGKNHLIATGVSSMVVFTFAA
ncbi:FAD binding domain-containing protein [Acetobacter orientalis]|uniref:FAD binding domain-containing protein n=1 Tax=Acetobacter orientalis TaxID=146474 RepID=A0A2Z5ZIA4_9PROT|nr:FAD binding domain-containing protein [Acetobacter orientalis]